MSNSVVNYYWFDHLVLRETGEAAIVQKAIKEHDFDTFDKIRKKYGEKFFPPTASLWENDEWVDLVDITTPEGFKMIDFSEFECG